MPKFILTIEDDQSKQATRTVEITAQEWPFVEAWATTYFPKRKEFDGQPVATRWHIIDVIQTWVEGGWGMVARQAAAAQANVAVQAAIDAARARKTETDQGDKI